MKTSMIDTSPQDADLEQCFADYMLFKYGAKSVSKEESEDFKTTIRRSNSDMSDGEIIAMLRAGMFNEQRMLSQMKGLFIAWAGLNLFLFGSVGFQQLLSIKAILWLGFGTAFVWSVVALLGAYFERTAMFFGVHYRVSRIIKYFIMYAVFKPIFNLIFIGKLSWFVNG